MYSLALTHIYTNKSELDFCFLSVSYTNCIRELQQFCMNMDLQQRLTIMYKTIPLVDMPDLLCDLYINIASSHFHIGLEALEKGDHKRCLYQMAESHYPLCEGQRHNTWKEVSNDINVLNEDIRMHTCMAESAQARETGTFQYLCSIIFFLNFDNKQIFLGTYLWNFSIFNNFLISYFMLKDTMNIPLVSPSKTPRKQIKNKTKLKKK